MSNTHWGVTWFILCLFGYVLFIGIDEILSSVGGGYEGFTIFGVIFLFMGIILLITTIGIDIIKKLKQLEKQAKTI